MGLVVGVNYVWCLVIIVIFTGRGGRKRWGRGEDGEGFKVILLGVGQATTNFYGG